MRLQKYYTPRRCSVPVIRCLPAGQTVRCGRGGGGRGCGPVGSNFGVNDITGWSWIPPISSTWAVVVGIYTHEIWAFAGEIKFKISYRAVPRIG